MKLNCIIFLLLIVIVTSYRNETEDEIRNQMRNRLPRRFTMNDMEVDGRGCYCPKEKEPDTRTEQEKKRDKSLSFRRKFRNVLRLGGFMAGSLFFMPHVGYAIAEAINQFVLNTKGCDWIQQKLKERRIRRVKDGKHMQRRRKLLGKWVSLG